MIINNWYIATASDELEEAPVRVRMLGCDFVLFRDANSEIACLSDICCHRGASLSRGKCINGCVQCPYHGWEFSGDGRVQAIPPLGEDKKIPARARIDSYPVAERYGYVWVFLGDKPEDERPVLPDLLPEYGDDLNWRMTRSQRDWDVHWARFMENLADSSHLFIVHSFGKHLGPKMDIWEVEETDWGLQIPQVYTKTPTADSETSVNAPQAEKRRDRSDILIQLSVIGMIQKNSQLMASGYDQVIWNALTPIDETHTRQFNLHFRNFQTEPEHDEAMQRTMDWGFDEDEEVVAYLQPPLTPASMSNELMVETDGPEKAYRDKADKLAKQLGCIDVRRVRDMRLDQVLVIPSPGRADSGNWVHKTVPLISGGQ
jgi:phenylpropionate dioxygenase-like ring-hydroxylating dioxygenase large terminal subunit